MLIVHVITRMIVGGAQENTLLSCRGARRRHGDRVVLLTGPSPGPEGELLAAEQAGEVEVRVIPALRRAIHPLADRRAYRQLRTALAELRPEVVHTHSAKAGFLGRLAAWSLGVPAVVHTVHGAPFHPYQPLPARELFRWCEWYAARRCHALVSVADALTEQLVAARVAEREKFRTIRSGMETAPFLHAESLRAATRARLGFEDAHVVIGKIARLFPLKGHEFLIAAAEPLCREFPQLRFLLVGDGVLRERLQAELDRRGLRERFVFTGLVPPAEIPAYCAAIDLLAHTSLREGLARALPQAMLAGRPAVSFDIDGAREVVRNGETGVLVPPRDVPGLIAALRSLIADAPLREQLGARGRELCREMFSAERMVDQLHGLYRELLDRPPRSVVGTLGIDAPHPGETP